MRSVPISTSIAAAALAAVLWAAPQDPPPGGIPTTGLPPVIGPTGPGLPGPGGVPLPRGRGPAGGGGRSPSAARAKRQTEPDAALAWNVWWEVNDDRFLRARALSRQADSQTTDADALLGETGKSPVARATAADVNAEIIPALKRAAKDPFVGVRRQAAIALGKAADGRKRDVYETVRALVADVDWEVRSAASLALGMLGAADGVPLLTLIARDDPAARQFCGIGVQPLTARERGFAALGIGMVGVESGLDSEPIEALIAVARDKNPHPDVRVFPSLALGVMHAFAAVPELQKIAFDAGAPEVVRAHAIVALGKLGGRGAVGRIVREGLSDRSLHVQRSSAIALGLLIEPEDARTLEAVVALARSGSDRAVRNFSMIALGQIGGAAARDQLLQLASRGNQHDRTFAALGLGLLAWDDEASRAAIGRALLAAFSEARADAERAAFAVALGLVGHKPAAAPVLQAMTGGGSPELRGHLATAAGLLGDRSAIPALRSIVQGTADGGLMIKAATALGSIGDTGAVKILLAVFDRAGNNQAELQAATLALGLIGDRSAVPALVKALEDRDSGRDYTRAYAAMALGILADKREHRALALAQENTNYLASTEWLWELLSLY